MQIFKELLLALLLLFAEIQKDKADALVACRTNKSSRPALARTPDAIHNIWSLPLLNFTLQAAP